MNSEHGPIGKRLNNLGANTSGEKIFTGGSEKGFYYNSHNGRLKSLDGNDGGWEKIKGEIQIYQSVFPGTWFCIGSIDVNKQKVEIWVEESNAQAPFIRIDGQIVAQSFDLPLTKEFPLQMDRNEGCGKGEFFLTDNNTKPLTFDIEDLLNSIATPKYFSGFNYDTYTINLDKPLDIPVFTGLKNVGGSGGLPVGSYQYAIAYVTKSGDRTAISEKTPTIPVVRNVSKDSDVYPWVKTYGDSSDVNSKTSYGPKIRFRVTNTLNYDSIEIIRFDYNIGAGINFTPNAKVVGRVDIGDGQIDYVDFVDPVDSDRDITLSIEEETQQSYLIDSAKAIRYYGTRLTIANVKVVEKIDNSVFKEISGNKMFPVMERLDLAGHNDPYNHTYRPSEMGGDKATFAVHYWDSVGGKTFVKEDEDLTNVQYPNRRDPMSLDSDLYSYGVMPVLPDVTSTLTEVFESFSHENAIARGDKENFKNILKKGSRLTTTVIEDSLTNPNDYQASLGSSTLVTRAPWLNWRPNDENDIGNSHRMLPNTRVDVDGFAGGLIGTSYDPEGFALDYYAKGYAFAGLENIPPWAKSFSVVRTESAGRVVAQGLGMYKISPGDYSGTSVDKITKKDNASMWSYFPDIESGLVPQSEIANIKNNPQDYKVQFVSPLGFFSETYSFESNAFKDHLVDMMTFARIQRDTGNINPGTDSVTGSLDYVHYNTFRGVTSPDFDEGGGWFLGDDGNKEMPLSFFNELKEGRGSYFHIGFTENIYGKKNVGGVSKRDFNDLGLKDWTEPFYMINIIKTGAQAPNGDIQGFKSTGTHIKVESIIGIGNSVDKTQEFELVDERWEDCCFTGETIEQDRYLYLRSITNNTERIFYDTNLLLPAQIATIEADIIANGFWVSPSGKEVVGIYSHINNGTGFKKNHDFTILFNKTSYFPTLDEYIIVKYDNRIPVRVFGGDTYVGETIFAPIDRDVELAGNSDNPEDSTQFVLNVGFPYGRYKMNPRYYRTKNTTAVNKIQDSDWHSFSHIRQMCVMFNCDTRIAAHYAHNESYPNQYFPLSHYVMRPNVWDRDKTLTENNLFLEYEEEYPEEFPDRLIYGGIRFKQSYNVDYSSRGRLEFFSKPSIGFEEEFDFCNLVLWSLPRATNQQDSPGLKTFLTGNAIEIEDAQGEIKFLYSATYSDKGSNLYAVAEKGVCLLLTNKSILSNVNADFLTSVASDSFIGGEFWIEREQGCSDEFWRGRAEGSTSTPGEAGNLELEFLIFPSSDSVYILANNEIRDVGDKEYINTLRPVLQAHPEDTSLKMAGFFDEGHNEYWLDISIPGGGRFNFKFFMENFQWVGDQAYEFDQYVFSDGKSFGMRSLETYELNSGTLINGLPIECSLTQIFSQEIYEDKEFLKIGIETGGREGAKPTKIEFLDQDLNVIAEMSQLASGGNPNWLLRYDQWQHFIPRLPNDGDRIQNQLLIYKIFHNLEADFKIVNTVVQFKILK